jgi:glycosyltransferase involved in cell wall biosynthesis
MPRALYFMPRTPASWGGAAALWVTVAGWAGATRRRGLASRIVTPGGELTEAECLEATGRGAAPRVSERYPWVPVELKQAARDAQRSLQMHRYHPTVDDADGPTAFGWQHHELFHRAGRAVTMRSGAPLIEYVHAPVVWEARRWGVQRRLTGGLLERFGERPSLLAADLVACVTDEVAERVVDFGVASDRVIISPMGVDPERFSPDADGTAWREQFADLGDFVVGWAGSFRKFHAIDLVLESLRELRSKGASVGLALAGDGQDRVRLEAKAEALGVSPYVRFVGQVDNRSMPAFLAAVDAAVITAAPEQEFHYSPLKLREYLATATPVVVPALGEMKRFITDGATGLQYEAGDAAGLSASIERLIHDPDLSRTLGGAGRRLVLDSGTWDVLVGQALERLASAG